jgi:hypothetical protein
MMTTEDLNAIRQIIRQELALKLGETAFATTAGFSAASPVPGSFSVSLVQCQHVWERVETTVPYEQCYICKQRKYYGDPHS